MTENTINNNPSPQSLIDLVLGEEPSAKGADTAPAELPGADAPPAAPDFNVMLEAATGGAFKSIEDLTALQESARKVTEYQQRLSELEANTAGTIKPANDFVAKLNDLLANGADTAKISTFWRLSQTDLDQMEPIDLLVFQKQMDMPSLTEAEVRAYVLAEYGLDGEDVDLNSLPAAKSVKLKIEAAAAKTKLAADRASLEVTPKTPDQSREVAEARQVQGQVAATYWAEVMDQLPVTVPFSYENKEKGIPRYDFSFNPRPEVVANARQAVLADVAARPEAYPKTKEGALMIQGAIKNLVTAYSQEDIMQAMFLDVYNGLMQQATLKNAGPVPNRPDVATSPKPSRPSLTSAMGV